MLDKNQHESYYTLDASILYREEFIYLINIMFWFKGFAEYIFTSKVNSWIIISFVCYIFIIIWVVGLLLFYILNQVL